MLTELERVTDEIGDLNSSVGELLREIADKERTEDPLLLDNLKLLFEPDLQANPLGLAQASGIDGFAAAAQCNFAHFNFFNTGERLYTANLAPLGVRHCRGACR